MTSPGAITRWYNDYLDDFDPASLRTVRLPKVSIVLPIGASRPDWLKVALESVSAQTYSAWELICIDDAADDRPTAGLLATFARSDPRVRVITDHQTPRRATASIAISAASGDYILFLEGSDMLEPHALARLCEAAVQDRGDLIYADEAITGERIEDILDIQARPQFSYLYYLSYSYFVHPVMVRTALATKVDGLLKDVPVRQDADFILRCLEHTQRVTHVPDVLYRARTTPERRAQNGAELMRAASDLRQQHLRRMGYPDATVRPGRSRDTFSYRFFATVQARVLGIIPTRNGLDLLRRCIDTVRATTKGIDLDLVVVDHDSDDPATLQYLEQVQREGTARVLRYSGVFNYSAINNFAVRNAGAGYDMLLFMNNDIEALDAGWLEAMMDLAAREDVGAVGSILLYPDGRVQHNGVFVGHFGPAEHAYRFADYGHDKPGYMAGLHATREYAAVTGACMIVPASVFAAVEGFDEYLQVGFNDIDLCLRIAAQGYRIVNCADSVLIHHESATRGHSPDDPHPEDTYVFKHRYPELTREGDAFYTPLMSKTNPCFELESAPFPRASTSPRTVRTDIAPRENPHFSQHR